MNTYEEIQEWMASCKNSKDKPASRGLLLGNGFSIAYNHKKFSYGALLAMARNEGRIGPIADQVFQKRDTQDFEFVIKSLLDSAMMFEILDPVRYRQDIDKLKSEARELKEALAQVLAGLHPDRPYDIEEKAYARVRRFIDGYDTIYTANYDLLLYWATMQDELPDIPPRGRDDGFRDLIPGAEYVVWDHLTPHHQNVYYLHGALHLYDGSDGLRKITWKRTDVALIDQIRGQLSQDAYPVYVAEGESDEKLKRIRHSDYLSRGLRSISNKGGFLTTYGFSFSSNDAHINNAIVHSKIERIAVGLYGDATGKDNQALISSVGSLMAQRTSLHPNRSLEVRYFDASSVQLW